LAGSDGDGKAAAGLFTASIRLGVLQERGAPSVLQNEEEAMRIIGLALILVLALGVLPAFASQPVAPPVYGGFLVEVLVDGRPAPQYAAYGVRYIEAIKGKDYSLRLRNPLGIRVAVALSVDGLNTIDARHTEARSARKWVLDPYQTITISGWQTSMDYARRFYFTSEEQSYGRALGKTQDLGIISAVFFRERVAQPILLEAPRNGPQSGSDASREKRSDGGQAAGASAAPPSARAEATVRPTPDDYAATGIGQRVDHPVVRIQMDLEDTPVASFNIRYEYRAQLVRLGILPPVPDPLARRQQARGFSDGFCPDPR
jgi:hypothetical protein